MLKREQKSDADERELVLLELQYYGMETRC
jgi:hypothetical protein